MAADDDHKWLECCTCRCLFALPIELYVAAHHSEAIHFYCPYGHVQHFRLPARRAASEARADPGAAASGGNVVRFLRPKDEEAERLQ